MKLYTVIQTTTPKETHLTGTHITRHEVFIDKEEAKKLIYKLQQEFDSKYAVSELYEWYDEQKRVIELFFVENEV